MTKGLYIVAITSQNHLLNESEKIVSILDKGEADIIHIRKPFWTIDETDMLIRSIPEKWHHKLKLHDHFDLLESYKLAGIHLNSRNPEAHPLALSVSRSCHTIEQLEESEHYDYVTLSPIFDSISKKEYFSAFDLDEIKPYLEDRNVVALGGVIPTKFDLLKRTGFYGAAMLGYFWL